MSPSDSPDNSKERLESLTVLVPKGAEYKAVKKGLRGAKSAPPLIAVPAGEAIKAFVQTLRENQRIEKNVLLMGLGGGLKANCQVGRSQLLSKVWNSADSPALICDNAITQQISARLNVDSVCVGVTCDRVVTAAAEKRRLGDRYQAQIVDMESFSLLQALPDHNVAILRVISDSCDFDLPDISQAIRSDGSLNTARLVISFAQKPRAALRFVKSSLKGLRTLEQLASNLSA